MRKYLKAWTQEEAVKAIAVWQKSASPKEAAKTLGIRLPVLSWRIQRLRKMGVKNIKKFPTYKTMAHLDLNALSALAEKELKVKVK